MQPTPIRDSIVLLGNPASGRGRGAAALIAAEAELRARGHAPVVLRTEAPSHAIQLARGAADDGASLLMVIGGDGTVRDAAEGLCSSTRGHPLPVGILPGGTGNDLARTLSLPRDLMAALDVALTGETRMLDVWTWNGTPFVNVTGVGLDAAAAETVNRRVRKLHGTLAYIVALCMTLPGFEPLRLSLRFPDGEWSGEAWLAAFANARFYGGGMQMAPQAEPDDGLLDVVVIENVSKIELLRQFPGLFKGAHILHPRVRSFRVAEVEVEAAAYPASVDGELIGATPARVVRATRQLAVRVPRPGT